MTFNEALEAKKEFSETTKEGDLIFKTIIVPKDIADFNEYIRYYRVSDFEDNSAQEFSKDKTYIVCSLWTNGTDVFKKVLKFK